jgi:peptidoglycan/xylan/chitin deacetylase (PgdA/CDA1 family)
MPASENKTESVQRRQVIVTTSWDDDAASGLKVAELLGARGLPGTFYVPTSELGRTGRLSGLDLRALSRDGFEVGAHTVSHRILTSLTPAELASEVGDCKQSLQQIVGKEVTTFCYPRGRFNAEVVRQVERAQYRGARSTQMLFSGSDFCPFEMPTTIQAYPHARSNYVKNLVRLRALPALAKSLPDLISFESWLELGKKTFDRTVRNGGIWHLYGHPWEIEKLNIWAQLGEMLDYISQRHDVIYLTNGELLKRVKPQRTAAPEVVSSNHEHTLVH